MHTFTSTVAKNNLTCTVGTVTALSHTIFVAMVPC
jgi:hypothetical protein